MGNVGQTTRGSHTPKTGDRPTPTDDVHPQSSNSLAFIIGGGSSVCSSVGGGSSVGGASEPQLEASHGHSTHGRHQPFPCRASAPGLVFCSFMPLSAPGQIMCAPSHTPARACSHMQTHARTYTHMHIHAHKRTRMHTHQWDIRERDVKRDRLKI